MARGHRASASLRPSARTIIRSNGNAHQARRETKVNEETRITKSRVACAKGDSRIVGRRARNAALLDLQIDLSASNSIILAAAIGLPVSKSVFSLEAMSCIWHAVISVNQSQHYHRIMALASAAICEIRMVVTGNEISASLQHQTSASGALASQQHRMKLIGRLAIIVCENCLGERDGEMTSASYVEVVRNAG